MFVAEFLRAPKGPLHIELRTKWVHPVNDIFKCICISTNVDILIQIISPTLDTVSQVDNEEQVTKINICR